MMGCIFRMKVCCLPRSLVMLTPFIHTSKSAMQFRSISPRRLANRWSRRLMPIMRNRQNQQRTCKGKNDKLSMHKAPTKLLRNYCGQFRIVFRDPTVRPASQTLPPFVPYPFAARPVRPRLERPRSRARSGRFSSSRSSGPQHGLFSSRQQLDIQFFPQHRRRTR